MILSNVEIHKAIDDGRLVIDPEPTPRLPQVMGAHCPYDTHSVDLTLGDIIQVPVDRLPLNVDFSEPGNIAELLRRSSDVHNVAQDGGYKLKPHQFIRRYPHVPLRLLALHCGDVGQPTSACRPIAAAKKLLEPLPPAN